MHWAKVTQTFNPYIIPIFQNFDKIRESLDYLEPSEKDFNYDDNSWTSYYFKGPSYLELQQKDLDCWQRTFKTSSLKRLYRTGPLQQSLNVRLLCLFKHYGHRLTDRKVIIALLTHRGEGLEFIDSSFCKD